MLGFVSVRAFSSGDPCMNLVDIEIFFFDLLNKKMEIYIKEAGIGPLINFTGFSARFTLRDSWLITFLWKRLDVNKT